MSNENFKSGFVTILGRPNAGKSTLMNALIGENIAITSRKPQTTRKNMRGIITDDDSQIIFVDTPGIHKSNNKLDEYMDLSIKKSMNDIDVLIYIIDVNINIDSDEIEDILKDIKMISNTKQYKILVINKIDVISDEVLNEKVDNIKNIINENSNKKVEEIFSDIVLVSSLKNKNINNLFEIIKKKLPNGPLYYDKEILTDEPTKHIVAEMIRQQCLYKLNKEIPHGIAITIEQMKFIKNSYHIEANLICEKESHKGIIIGKAGSMLKNIGTASRIAIEKFLDTKVVLKLYVTVKENWRNEKTNLVNFGYDIKRV